MDSLLDSKRNHVSIDGGEEEREKSLKALKEIISTLPKTDDWLAFSSLYEYQNFWIPETAVYGVLSLRQHFQAQPSDIFLCSGMKTGTTWLKALAFAIATRTSFDDSTNPLLFTVPHYCILSSEFFDASSINRNTPENNTSLFHTHMPYSVLPKSVIDSGCKIVYMCRDPKDTFVSTYHFVAKMMMAKNMEPLRLEKAFELFCQGEHSFGPYWDHVLGYWRASLDSPHRFLFLKYEDMKEDTASYAKKLAEFIGYPFSSEEEEKGVVEKIVKMCSFGNLSNLEVNKNGKLQGGPPIWDMQSHSIFFRKGNVGDWENYLTPEMAARIDLITEQKLDGWGLDLIHRRSK